MNDTETLSQSQGPGMETQIVALQRQIFLLLLALIVVTATMVFFLYYQSHITSYDLNQARPRAMQIIQAYNRNAMAIDGLNKQFIKYGETHPGFQPILMKYGLINPPASLRQ